MANPLCCNSLIMTLITAFMIIQTAIEFYNLRRFKRLESAVGLQ